MDSLYLFTGINVIAGVLIARNASNASLAVAAILSAVSAPVQDISPARLVLSCTLPAVVIGMVSSALYDRMRNTKSNRTSP